MITPSVFFWRYDVSTPVYYPSLSDIKLYWLSILLLSELNKSVLKNVAKDHDRKKVQLAYLLMTKHICMLDK
jgi:hypothetical protein